MYNTFLFRPLSLVAYLKWHSLLSTDRDFNTSLLFFYTGKKHHAVTISFVCSQFSIKHIFNILLLWTHFMTTNPF
jgi:hypothetical protein